MLLQDTIGEHLLEVDKAAREREEVILKQLEEKDPLSDEEKDQMAWIKTFWYWMSKHQRFIQRSVQQLLPDAEEELRLSVAGPLPILRRCHSELFFECGMKMALT